MLALCIAASIKQKGEVAESRSCLTLTAFEFLPAFSPDCINRKIPERLMNHAQLELRSVSCACQSVHSKSQDSAVSSITAIYATRVQWISSNCKLCTACRRAWKKGGSLSKCGIKRTGNLTCVLIKAFLSAAACPTASCSHCG